ncbi:MAG: shikimate kinase [Eubacterium sp.]|nr:shikimate kinase [Eubacterium sp.]MBR7061199.1 shikimate kinase [Eubacterium sp.]
MNNIILCGFMGSGKTVVGKELAKIMGRKFIDTDELIEKEQGMAIKAIFAARGEEYFRELEYEACKETAKLKNCIISTGGGALTFERNVDEVKKGGKVVFLDASFEIICERIGDSQNRPLFQDKEKAKQLFDERKDKYIAAADYIIDGDLSARKAALDIAAMFR